MIRHHIDDRGAAYTLVGNGKRYQLISTRYPSRDISPEEASDLLSGMQLPHDIINRR